MRAVYLVLWLVSFSLQQTSCDASIKSFFGDLVTKSQEFVVSTGSDFFEEALALEEAFNSTGIETCEEDGIERILLSKPADCVAFENINTALVQNQEDIGNASIQLFTETLDIFAGNDFDAEFFATLQNGSQYFAITNSTQPTDMADMYSCTRQIITNITDIMLSTEDARRSLQDIDFATFLASLLGTRSQPECLVAIVTRAKALKDGFDKRNEQSKVFLIFPATILGVNTLYVLSISAGVILFCCCCLCFCLCCCIGGDDY